MAEDQDEASKTEEASEHKLSKAREEGHVPMSQEVKSWFMLFAGLMMIWGMLPFVLKYIMRLAVKYIEIPHEFPTDPLGLRDLFLHTALDVFIALIMPLGLFLILAIAAAVVQVGFMYAPKKMALKWERINLFENAKEFINKQKIVEMLKGIMKIIAVGYAGWLIIKPKIINILNSPSLNVDEILTLMYILILMILLTMVMILFVIAFGDFFYQKFSFLKKQRMTKQEVKDEYKNTEGDPQIKMRLKSIRQERVRKRMMSNVPKASVVVTNPTHFAVAILYDPLQKGYEVPVCVAKGQDFVALRIKEIAKENDVIIYEDPPLARALFPIVEIDKPIPEDYYAPVAKIIQYVYEVKGKSLPEYNEPN